MRIHRLALAGIALWFGGLLLGWVFLLSPAGTVGAGALQTPSATVDPGQRTPDADATPSVSPTRPPTTPTNTPTPTPRAGALTVSPASAAAGAEVTIAGSGFSPNALIVVIVEDSAGATTAYAQPSVDGSGGFTMRLATSDWQAGEYAVSAASLPDVRVLSRASFTLTGAAGMPGLPNTGDGGTARPTAWAALLLASAAALTLLGLGGIARRRRAS